MKNNEKFGDATGVLQRERPTLKTIAFMTGLGVTTVSRALKDAPDIGAETKERVRMVARQLGYQPNRAGVRLRTGKTNVIALVLPLIGIIFVVETMSVILQVGYFRMTGGKRLFRMSPLHHHFELGGWDEEKITLRFWIVAVLAGLLGVTLFLASLPDFQLTA